MNSLTSRQRKIVYAICILILLWPIIYFGAPVTEDIRPGTQNQNVEGGKLARMRHEHELGESTIGAIDPSSAAANLVLLGFRGLAASVLHAHAIDYQTRKDWAKLKTTVETILRLQPHYVEVWKFQGWNLAFNVSREWDRVDDRFYWVKEGLKFLQKGTERNSTATILFHNVGDFVGRKIGYSDEKQFFRRFFISDPDDEKFEGEADSEINPDGKDNYLVARDWFLEANERDRIYPVKGMTRELFRKSPSQALFDYANAITAEGKFEQSAIAWRDAYTEWRDVFGNEVFFGNDNIPYKLYSTRKELAEMAEQNGVTLRRQTIIHEQRTKMVNYNFWLNLSECERDEVTVAARKAIFRGKQEYAEGNVFDDIDDNGKLHSSTAQNLFEEGIEKTREMFDLYPGVLDNDDKILDALLAVHYWKEIQKLNATVPRADHALAQFAEDYRAYQSEVEKMFQRETN